VDCAKKIREAWAVLYGLGMSQSCFRLESSKLEFLAKSICKGIPGHYDSRLPGPVSEESFFLWRGRMHLSTPLNQ
jgi:hypothetical protein